MDIKEVYDNLASTYDKDHFTPNSAMEYAEKRRMKLICSYLENSEDLRLLDVACGTGTYLSIAKEFGAEVVGCDVSKEMIQACRDKGLYSTMVNDYQNLPFKDATFDMVLCINAIHYSRDPQRVVSEMQRVLVDGGIILLTYFNLLNFRSANYIRRSYKKNQPISFEKRYGTFYIKQIMSSMTLHSTCGINMLPFPSTPNARSERLLNLCQRVEDHLASTICMHFFNETFLALEKPQMEV
jgi:ubiquinone/menaquinone biosynthesis C-methylase UbiE